MDETLIRFERSELSEGEWTAWTVLYREAVIGRLSRYTSLARGFSRSQMSTRHYGAYRVSPDGAHLDENDERMLRRELKRDKTSRNTAATYLLTAYERAGVALPEPPPEEISRAA
jgi:hypothetical protein